MISVSLFILDRIGLWLEKKGWLYYRHNKPTGGGLGNALADLSRFLNPSTQHIVEEKQSGVQRKHQSRKREK